MTQPSTVSKSLPIGFREFVAMMAAIMAIQALGIDAMLAALPQIGESLGVREENRRQLVIAAYMFGFGTMQIVYGPLSDRYGRRPVLLISMVLFSVTSLIASFATSFTLLIAARVLQGMAAAAGRVIVVSVVRDRYSGRQMARVMSLTVIIFLLAPILAPTIGQLLLFIGPWQIIFDALAFYAIAVALWAALRLPETLAPENRRQISVRPLLSAFGTALGNRYSLGYTLGLTLTFGAMLGYINSAQQIFADSFREPELFTLAFAISAASMGVSAFINSRFVEAFGSRKISHGALLLALAVSILHVIWSLSYGDGMISFIIFQSLTMFFFGFVGANFNAMAMEPMGHIAGTASSVQGTISTLGAALVGYIIGQCFDGTALPVVLGYVICAIGALLIVLVTERGRLFRPHHAPVQ